MSDETIAQITWAVAITVCVITIAVCITIAHIYTPCNVPSN